MIVDDLQLFCTTLVLHLQISVLDDSDNTVQLLFGESTAWFTPGSCLPDLILPELRLHPIIAVGPRNDCGLGSSG